MNKNNTGNVTVGNIVAEFPLSAEVFQQYKIDYCCAGNDTLEEAAKKVKVNPQEVRQALDENYNGYREMLTSKGNETVDEKVMDMTNIQLIQHILDTHHVYTKRKLQEIDDLVFKILKVHFGSHTEELLEVHRLFGALKTELEAHLIKEEEQLFPIMIDYEKSKDASLLAEITDYIQSTEAEHDGAGDILKELEKVTQDFTAPPDTCLTYIQTYKALDELQKNIFTHIHKENSILFKRYTV